MSKTNRMPRADYDAELRRLQRELVKLQEWVRNEGLRVCVIFEGRDAAGKGGVIKRIVERTNPRVVKRKMSNFRLKRPEHFGWPQPAAHSFREAVALI